MTKLERQTLPLMKKSPFTSVRGSLIPLRMSLDMRAKELKEGLTLDEVAKKLGLRTPVPKRPGESFRCLLPGHLDKTPSARLWGNLKGFTCQARCSRQVGMIDLWMAHKGCDFSQAVEQMEDAFRLNEETDSSGMDLSSATQGKLEIGASRPKSTCELQEDNEHSQPWEFVASYTYYSSSRKSMVRKTRFLVREKDGSQNKRFSQKFSVNGGRIWDLKKPDGMPGMLPLHWNVRDGELAGRTLVIHEGEKAAEACLESILIIEAGFLSTCVYESSLCDEAGEAIMKSGVERIVVVIDGDVIGWRKAAKILVALHAARAAYSANVEIAFIHAGVVILTSGGIDAYDILQDRGPEALIEELKVALVIAPEMMDLFLAEVEMIMTNDMEVNHE